MRVPQQIHDAILQHARFCAPLEACGLLATDGTGALRMVYCLTNVERSRRRFTVSPQEHFKALQHAERSGWSIGGVFHSHPTAPARPSVVDVAQALDPRWLYVIAGPLASPELRAFTIARGEVNELEVEVG
ncbi:MAG TPA: M67 family metallopeptidase [Acidimicrobiia bacterium]|nr:M67 family metallopeptidase [Acidimicrobiia bacterium]